MVPENIYTQKGYLINSKGELGISKKTKESKNWDFQIDGGLKWIAFCSICAWFTTTAYIDYHLLEILSSVITLNNFHLSCLSSLGKKGHKFPLIQEIENVYRVSIELLRNTTGSFEKREML